MTDFVTLTCPTCGGKLKITEDVERFACNHCGNEHIVRRGGGITTLKPITDSLQRIETHASKTADELASLRLSEEIHRSEESLRRFFLSTGKQRSFLSEMATNLRMVKQASFFESISITPEEIIEKLIGLDARDLARVVRIEAKVRSKNDERIKMLNKYVSMKMEKQGISNIIEKEKVKPNTQALKSTSNNKLRWVFFGLGLVLLILGFYFFTNPDPFRGKAEWLPAFFVVFGLYCLAQGSGIFGRKKG